LHIEKMWPENKTLAWDHMFNENHCNL
jgi:hypothetical protein